MNDQAAISRRDTLLASTTLLAANTLPAIASLAQTQPLPPPQSSGADAYASIDGSAEAPSGPAPYPNILSKYHLRGVAEQRIYGAAGPPNYSYQNANYPQPPWRVAGVDYNVGVDPAIPLTPYTGQAIAGTSWSSPVLTVSGSGATIQNWDFSGITNFQLYLATGATNCTIQNCNFKVTQTGGAANPLLAMQFAADTTGLLLTKCTFDGNGLQTNSPTGPNLIASSLIVMGNNTGTCTMTYCWLKNSFGQLMCGDGQATTWVVKYNLFENANVMNGVGAVGGTVHPDWYETTNNNYTNWVWQFNTGIQHNTASFPNCGGTQGWDFSTDGTSFNGLDMGWNTTINSPSPAYADLFMRLPNTAGYTGINIHDNYCDAQTAPFILVAPSNGSGSPVVVNNIDMVNGRNIGTPAAPVISTATPSGQTAVVTGTSSPSITSYPVTVTVYDGATSLGTTAVTASGTWSFTTGALAVGAHNFTATATQTPKQVTAGGKNIAWSKTSAASNTFSLAISRR